MRRNIFATRRESSSFSAADCVAMAASDSRSIPAQNDLPAPVTMTTRVLLFSISSSADCSSPIMRCESALRLSGRFNVMVAICPDCSSSSVSYMTANLLALHGSASALGIPPGVSSPDKFHQQEYAEYTANTPRLVVAQLVYPGLRRAARLPALTV